MSFTTTNALIAVLVVLLVTVAMAQVIIFD